MWHGIQSFSTSTKHTLGLIVIICLTLLVAYFLFNFRRDLKVYSLLITPYFIWLSIANISECIHSIFKLKRVDKQT